MQFTTISQKGQIVVPKDIRDKLNLKPSDFLKVVLVNNNIIVSPLPSSAKFLGMFKVAKPVTKIEIKDIYKDYISKKFVNR